MAKPSAKKIAEMGTEYLELQAVAAKTKARMEEIQATLRDCMDLGPHLAGAAKVSIQRNVRRDDAAFMAVYPFESFPDYYKPAIDSATIKRELAPAVLERFQIVGENKVIVTAIEQGA